MKLRRSMRRRSPDERWARSALLTLSLLLAPLITINAAPAVAAATHKTSHPTTGKKHHRKSKRAAGAKTSKRSAKNNTRQARRAADPAKLTMPASPGSPVVDVAQQYLGRPYRFGSSHGAYDCSGFVRRVFADLGVDLPHSAREQFDLGDRVPRDDLSAGDLVFFRTYRKGASHVGIYIAGDKFIHAATRGGQVQVDSLDQVYYANRYLGARRVEPQS